jgi:hypothetical protein
MVFSYELFVELNLFSDNAQSLYSGKWNDRTQNMI